MNSHRITELGSGVRIVTEAMPSVRSVSLGYWIGTGSRGESDAQAGLSHLIEHLLFKGTARYESLEIDQLFDGMGAELNAGTGKETTSVYSRVIDEHLDLAFDVMSDMVFRPRIDDVDSEREVILEEIAMYEDDPQDKVFDVLGEAVFGDHPLGRSIIGSAEVVARTPIETIRAFHDSRYVASNVVIAAAGAVDHDALVALAESRVPNGGRSADAPQPLPAPAILAPRVQFERKDTEQYHVCLGGPGIARYDERRYALRVLDTIFGGTSSSRLFQEVREKRGLAYSVYSFSGQFSDTGQIGLYVKLWKDVGLRVCDEHGKLFLLDDPRLAPIWAAVAEANIPVLVHSADPVAFFRPLDATNERYEELLGHPDWHFYGPQFPSMMQLLDALEHTVAMNPTVTFIGAHVGCYAEDLAWVDRMLTSYPNFTVDISARIAELGRQPRATRRLVLKHPDRVLFGTDIFPPKVDDYRRYLRFLSTDDENFPYSGSNPPGTGRWRISGIDLPADVLAQVVSTNARRILPSLAQGPR